jgi:hypothetical protein
MLKLEWKALRKAINLEGEDKQTAIRDALIFRGTNELHSRALPMRQIILRPMRDWRHSHILCFHLNQWTSLKATF